jgi:hypothetical protein
MQGAEGPHLLHIQLAHIAVTSGQAHPTPCNSENSKASGKVDLVTATCSRFPCMQNLSSK